MTRRARRALAGAALAATLALLLAGCFDVQSPDLFLITRTGQGATLTILVNNSGTIRCDRGQAKPISSARLITARDLSDNLAGDATHGLTIPPAAGDAYYYRIKLQQGTVSFPDRAADASHPILAQTELFALRAAQQACGGAG